MNDQGLRYHLLEALHRSIDFRSRDDIVFHLVHERRIGYTSRICWRIFTVPHQQYFWDIVDDSSGERTPRSSLTLHCRQSSERKDRMLRTGSELSMMMGKLVSIAALFRPLKKVAHILSPSLLQLPTGQTQELKVG